MAVEDLAEAPPPTADKRIAQLHAHWLGLHPEPGVLPGRQHFDPAAVPRLLPFIWLGDVQRTPLRFRYRLLGTEHLLVFGRDYTGAWLDEVHPGFANSPAYPQYLAAVEEGRVGYRRGHTLRAPSLPRRYRGIERLLLPLARDGRTTDMLLAISIYHRAS
jgi:hypothetical protein